MSDLLSATGDTWDHSKVDAMFSMEDAKDIKQILVGALGVDDVLAWNYTRDGVFTARSVYHLLMTGKRGTNRMAGTLLNCANP